MTSRLFVAALALAAVPVRETAVDELLRRLSGPFSSDAQSRLDPDYAEVRCDGVRLWKERKLEYWLYVAKTVPGLPESPFGQAVYRVTEDPFDRRLTLAAYAIKEPGRFASRLDTMTPQDLVARPGCSILLIRESDDTFTGGTKGRDCPGDGPGVTYVTSEWTVTKDTLTRWDRGFDAEGRQVWGATKGPYVFRRVVASSAEEDAP